MEAGTEDVRKFISYYDAIRSDKKGAVSRLSLDTSFLIRQFDRFFSIGIEDSGPDGQVLTLYDAAPGLMNALGAEGSRIPLADLLPTETVADLGQLLRELMASPDRGILAHLARDQGQTDARLEMVMLPVIDKSGDTDRVSAIGLTAWLTDPDPDPDPRAPLEGPMRVHEKTCFDLRVPLPPVGRSFLVQCLINMKNMFMHRAG